MAGISSLNKQSYNHDIVAQKLSNLKKELDSMIGGNNLKQYPLQDITK